MSDILPDPFPRPPFKTIFMGTPVFAAAHLEAMHARGDVFDVRGVFTQPDKPVGRSQKPEASPVKKFAVLNNIPVYQPESLKHSGISDLFKSLAPDLVIVVAYGHILPPDILNIPILGTYNVHASLLPKYRGASPIQTTLMNGDSRSGVTIIRLDAGVDTGAILRQVTINVDLRDDCASLTEKLQKAGQESLVSLFTDVSITRRLPPLQIQNAAEASYVKKLNKSMSRIDWQGTAVAIHNQIRALNIWPVCVAEMRHHKQGSLMVRLFKSMPFDCDTAHGFSPGHIFIHPEYKLSVRCGQGCLQILELQLPGKKRLPATAFLQGFTLQHSDCFVL